MQLGHATKAEAAFKKALALKRTPQCWHATLRALIGTLTNRFYTLWVPLQLGHVTEAEAAFKKALVLKDPHNAGVHAIRVLAQMKQGLGNHWEAIRVLNKAIELNDNPERIQCLFLRGALLSSSCSFLCTTANCSGLYVGAGVQLLHDLRLLYGPSVMHMTAMFWGLGCWIPTDSQFTFKAISAVTLFCEGYC